MRKLILQNVCLYALLPIIFFSGCYDVKSAIGKDVPEVIGKLGTPKYEHTFYLSDSTLLEYRTGLTRIFPHYLSQKEHIEIKEILWERHKFNNTIVWFHHKDGKWIAVLTLEWNPWYTQF
jgi:hypothetical protein